MATEIPLELTVGVGVVIENNIIKVICTPPTLSVRKGDSYVMLRFVMQTEKYEFPAVGAVIIREPTSQFPIPSWTESGGQSVKLFDFNTSVELVEYIYDVYVVPSEPYKGEGIIANGANEG